MTTRTCIVVEIPGYAIARVAELYNRDLMEFVTDLNPVYPLNPHCMDLVEGPPESYQFDEEDVKYSTPDYFDEMLAEGIPFSIFCPGEDSGCESTQHLRFTKTGELNHAHFSDGDATVSLETLNVILEKGEHDDAILASLLRRKVEKLSAWATPLPWANQQSYGKRYMAMKVIKGKRP